MMVNGWALVERRVTGPNKKRERGREQVVASDLQITILPNSQIKV